jgi:hypothetical protein
VGDYYMDHTDVLDIRVYIPMLLIFLIPLGLIRNLKYLVPFSALANIFIIISFVITLYYIFKDSLDIGDLEHIANVQQLPLFFATVIFAMEGIGVVSTEGCSYMWYLVAEFSFLTVETEASRSQWSRGLRHERSSPTRTLGSCVQIPVKDGWLFAFILFVL